MLDIKFIRENPDLIKEAARKKHISFDVEELLKIDDERKNILRQVEDFRAKQNSASDNIAQIKDELEKEKAIAEMRKVKGDLLEKEDELKKIKERWNALMLEVPNVPDPSVPEGNSDADNQEIRKWGEIPEFGFEPKSHVELMEKLGLADFERGTKISGFRGYFLQKEAARLSMAIWQLAAEEMAEKGYEFFLAPSLVKENNLYGTGHFPQGKEDVYKTQDDLYLSATAEIPMTGFYADEILSENDLPKKYAAFSPCFRREAGSYSKDVKGLFRLHEFFKVEQFILCKNAHQESVKWHEEITQNAESLLQKLGLPYRVVALCGAELGRAHVKTYDIEVWIPSEKKYRESHSSSYYHDFQTRRFNTRYRNREEKIRFCHSLNNTLIATPRILISLLENYQQKDGSIKVPEALQKYLGKSVIS